CLLFLSSRRRHTRSKRDWSSDVCSSDLRFGQQEALAISANEFWSLCTALAQDGLQGRIDRPLGHVGSDVGASCCLGHVVAVLSSTRILKRTKRTTTTVGASQRSGAGRSGATDPITSPPPRRGPGSGVAGGNRVAQ